MAIPRPIDRGIENQQCDAYWLALEPVVDGVVDGAGFVGCDIGAAGFCRGAEPVVAEPVVAAGGAGTLLAVVSLIEPRVNTNINTNARTTCA
jgi:hypothetical protein